MKRKVGNTKGLPASTPGLPREYIERLARGNADGAFVQLSIPAEAAANTLLAETTEDHLFLYISKNDALYKAIQNGQIISICTKDELIAAAERDDEALLAQAEREVATLFRAISESLGEDVARRIFTGVSARAEGRPRKTDLYLIDRLLLWLNQKQSRRGAATLAHRLGFGQSIEANEKRLQRLMRSRRV